VLHTLYLIYSEGYTSSAGLTLWDNGGVQPPPKAVGWSDSLGWKS
jgi:hypothetical protein